MQGIRFIVGKYLSRKAVTLLRLRNHMRLVHLVSLLAGARKLLQLLGREADHVGPPFEEHLMDELVQGKKVLSLASAKVRSLHGDELDVVLLHGVPYLALLLDELLYQYAVHGRRPKPPPVHKMPVGLLRV